MKSKAPNSTNLSQSFFQNFYLESLLLFPWHSSHQILMIFIFLGLLLVFFKVFLIYLWDLVLLLRCRSTRSGCQILLLDQYILKMLQVQMKNQNFTSSFRIITQFYDHF